MRPPRFICPPRAPDEPQPRHVKAPPGAPDERRSWRAAQNVRRTAAGSTRAPDVRARRAARGCPEHAPGTKVSLHQPRSQNPFGGDVAAVQAEIEVQASAQRQVSAHTERPPPKRGGDGPAERWSAWGTVGGRRCPRQRHLFGARRSGARPVRRNMTGGPAAPAGRVNASVISSIRAVSAARSSSPARTPSKVPAKVPPAARGRQAAGRPPAQIHGTSPWRSLAGD